jgi:DNA-binding MarR family transcriptional regulator
VYSCGCNGDSFDLTDEEVRRDYLAHLKDSAERLKIMAHKMSLQIKELEEKGYFTTDLYYPE